MNIRAKLLTDYYIGGTLQAVLKPVTVLLGKILRRNHDLSLCSSVTFIKMLGGGSLVIAYPALLAMKNTPQIKQLRLITTPSVKPFADVLGIFDEIIVIRDNSAVTLLTDAVNALRRLYRCDAIVDLEIHSRLTTVFSVMTCAVNRVGFYTGISFWRQKLATHLLFCNIGSGIYYFYDQIAELFGSTLPDMGICIAAFRQRLGVMPRTPEAARLRIALAPCCSDLGRERMLKPAEWVDVLKRRFLHEDPARQIETQLLGGRGDQKSLDELADLLRMAFPGITVVNLAGKTSLSESVRGLADVDELICIDSALLHFARLLGVPTISFWGPTDPASRLRASEFNRDKIHYRRLPCSPCVHVAQEPPCAGDNVCIQYSVYPEREMDANPKWILASEPINRFGRKLAP
ncbi:MAG: glycosyltransferase family 9 protein [Candidatus Solibacter sp.]